VPETSHFYHIWADGHWKVPVHDHLKALRESQFPGSVHVGIVGTPHNRDDVKRYVSKFWSWETDFCAEGDSGYEQVTISALRDYVHRDGTEPYVLYAHTKGAFAESVARDNWREAMTEPLVRYWRLALAALTNYDAVGLYWLTPEEFSDRNISTPFFGGNFWWATAAYLRTLPLAGNASRFDAEHWIGLGNPKVLDLQPGWPPFCD
jgi:hypothetical protein